MGTVIKFSCSFLRSHMDHIAAARGANVCFWFDLVELRRCCTLRQQLAATIIIIIIIIIMVTLWMKKQDGIFFTNNNIIHVNLDDNK